MASVGTQCTYLTSEQINYYNIQIVILHLNSIYVHETSIGKIQP